MGGAVSTPGLYQAVAFSTYAAWPALNFSALKMLRRSPMHFRHVVDVGVETTDAMRLGSATHCAVLEPEEFAKRYAIWDRRSENTGNLCPRNGQYWDAFIAGAGGREVITDDDRSDSMKMADILRNDPAAQRYLRVGQAEVSMVWAGRVGRLCKGRIDWLTTIDSRPCIVGLKTTRDARPFPFGAQCARLGYHLQWAFYHDGFVALTGEEPIMREIVIESAPPHDVVVNRIPEEVIDQGRDDYMALVSILNTCERENRWPGAADGQEVDVSLPSWAYPGADDLGDLDLEAA